MCAFETGDALLGVFFKKRADLVILDIMMPGTNGLTCCRLIREKDSVPIILLTAKDTEYDYVNGILQGGDDYLTKPFRPTVLLMRVKSLLRRVEEHPHDDDYEGKDNDYAEYGIERAADEPDSARYQLRGENNNAYEKRRGYEDNDDIFSFFHLFFSLFLFGAEPAEHLCEIPGQFRLKAHELTGRGVHELQASRVQALSLKALIRAFCPVQSVAQQRVSDARHMYTYLMGSSCLKLTLYKCIFAQIFQNMVM